MRTENGAQAFLAYCQARNLRPSTIHWYENKLRHFACLFPKIPNNPEQVENFLATIPGAPETKHAYFRVLRAFYNFIIIRYKHPNPMRHVQQPRCPKKLMPTLEPVELLLLLNTVTKPRDKALLTLLVDTGIRASELAGLRWQDIKTDTILVRGKTGEREVPISEETRRQICQLTDLKHEQVFMGEHGPLTRKGIYHLVKHHMKTAGVKGPKLGPHRLRHTFGKAYLINGGDVRSLQEIMGHTNITTTEKYAALTMQDTIKKHHKFTPLHSVRAAAQEKLFDVIQEAETLVNNKKKVDE